VKHLDVLDDILDGDQTTIVGGNKNNDRSDWNHLSGRKQ
jgi:hypothetical protein